MLVVSGAEITVTGEIGDQARYTLTCLLAELPLKQAVKLAAAITGENKSALYALALSLKAESDADADDT